MPSVTTRIDERSRLLRELREAAGKGFTGAIEVLAPPGRDITVYLDNGKVRAIQSGQFEPPATQLAECLTGQRVPEGVNPLQFLSESGSWDTARIPSCARSKRSTPSRASSPTGPTACSPRP